jgi:1,4-dihydroxy-2-naphthoate octaprenyltransferase
MLKLKDDLPPTIAKPMRFGLTGLGLALVGVAFALSIDYGPHNPLSYVVFGITVVGVLMGVVAVVWGWGASAAKALNRSGGN